MSTAYAGSQVNEPQRGDDDADEDDEDDNSDQERLPIGCLSVLTDQMNDPNVTHWRENELAKSKNGCYQVHQEVKHR